MFSPPPAEDAKVYPMGTLWGFSTTCNAKKRVRLASSAALWVVPKSLELQQDVDVASIGYFLNFRCEGLVLLSPHLFDSAYVMVATDLTILTCLGKSNH